MVWDTETWDQLQAINPITCRGLLCHPITNGLRSPLRKRVVENRYRDQALRARKPPIRIALGKVPPSHTLPPQPDCVVELHTGWSSTDGNGGDWPGCLESSHAKRWIADHGGGSARTSHSVEMTPEGAELVYAASGRTCCIESRSLTCSTVQVLIFTVWIISSRINRSLR